eukprot:1546722-Rhodomonas_salina.1
MSKASRALSMDSQGGSDAAPGHQLYTLQRCISANGQNLADALLAFRRHSTCSLQMRTAPSARACIVWV